MPTAAMHRALPAARWLPWALLGGGLALLYLPTLHDLAGGVWTEEQ